jgi:hypothetical protein
LQGPDLVAGVGSNGGSGNPNREPRHGKALNLDAEKERRGGEFQALQLLSWWPAQDAAWWLEVQRELALKHEEVKGGSEKRRDAAEVRRMV